MAGAPTEEAPDGLFVPLADSVEDWEVFINFEPRFPTPSLPAVSLGIESSIRQPGSTAQNQQVLVYSHAPVICAQKSRKQDEIPRNLISIGNGHPSITARSPAVSETGDEGSHPSASSTISSNKTKSTKRRFDACISSFSSGEDPSQQPRKRRGYLAGRRKEVAKMRKVGACQRCRMRKLTCQTSGSCDPCINSVGGSMIIGERICVRHSLEELRFRGGADLLHESHDRQSIQSSFRPDRSVSRTVYLRFRCYDTGMPLQLEVYDCSQNPYDDDKVVSYTLSAKSPNEPRIPQFSTLATPKYAIFDQSLPSPQDLEEWIKQQVDPIEHTWSPSAMLFSSFRSLLTAYLNTGVELPSQGLLKAALSIMNLYECWRNVLLVQGEQSHEDMHYISKTAGLQIALIAKQGIAEYEMEILSEIDALICKPKRPSKENEFPIWAGFWSLSLLYRDILRRYRYMSHSVYYPKGHFDTAIALARHMYHILTSSYSYLFRNRHPLDVDWQKDGNLPQIDREVDRQRMWNHLDRVKERTRLFCKIIRPFKVISPLNSPANFQLIRISTTKMIVL
ncbi:hypothetical protein BGZ57DRAFT_862297 [Hyaloscypha finlandica]|nr:hypothetical protein BGZ57DRAFT_862297 [Hyaloscypha finlandica]